MTRPKISDECHWISSEKDEEMKSDLLCLLIKVYLHTSM